jgi:hypothetical protein
MNPVPMPWFSPRQRSPFSPSNLWTSPCHEEGYACLLKKKKALFPFLDAAQTVSHLLPALIADTRSAPEHIFRVNSSLDAEAVGFVLARNGA